MANEQNLIPFSKREPRERSELGRKGAKASTEAKIKKRTLKNNMKLLLSLDVKDKSMWNYLSKLGIAPEDIDNSQLVTLALFEEAKNGNVNAIKEINTLMGEYENKSDVNESEESHNSLMSAIKQAVQDED